MSRNRYRADQRASSRGLYPRRDWIALHPAPASPSDHGASGLPVDRFGEPAIDPTRNVIALNDASIRRIDDMQELYARLQDEKIRRMEREATLAAQMVELRAIHQHALDTLEAKRLDAVRSVDQLAVKTEADRSAAAITALATTAATTAETLRNAVNTSTTNLATQLTNTVNAITERIAALEKSSYEGKGKQAVADPMMAEMVAEMRSLTSRQAGDAGKQTVTDPLLVELAREVRDLVTAQASHVGKSQVADPALLELLAEVHRNSATIAATSSRSEGLSDGGKLLIGAVGLLLSVLTIGGMIFGATRSLATQAPTSTTPQVIYVPAPPGAMLPTTPPQAPPR